MNEIDFLVVKSVKHLSLLVAEKIYSGEWCEGWVEGKSLFNCAEDLNDTGVLLEHLRSQKGIQLRITPVGCNGTWQVDRVDPAAAEKPVVAHGSTIAIAVCLAALRCLEYSAVLE